MCHGHAVYLGTASGWIQENGDSLTRNVEDMMWRNLSDDKARETLVELGVSLNLQMPPSMEEASMNLRDAMHEIDPEGYTAYWRKSCEKGSLRCRLWEDSIVFLPWDRTATSAEYKNYTWLDSNHKPLTQEEAEKNRRELVLDWRSRSAEWKISGTEHVPLCLPEDFALTSGIPSQDSVQAP